VGGADGMWTSISPHYYATHTRSPARFRPRRADWPSPLMPDHFLTVPNKKEVGTASHARTRGALLPDSGPSDQVADLKNAAIHA
jgi:hypothetical protein